MLFAVCSRLVSHAWNWSDLRLQRQLIANKEATEAVWTTPTVAEEFGLDLPLSAWVEFRSGNSEATD